MKQFLILLTITCIISPLASADTVLGIYSGGGVWHQEYDGNIGKSNIAIDDELGLDDQNLGYFYLALEHPIPVLPNIKLQYVDISTNGNRTLTSTALLDRVAFPAADTVATDLDFTFVDFTLYYELLDNWVNLDVGLTARYFDGDTKIASLNTPALRESADFRFIIPMVYGNAQFDLPLTGLSVGAEFNGIAFSSSSVADIMVKISYQTDLLPLVDIGVDAGYRYLALDLDDDDVSDFETKVDVSGPFVGLTLHF